MPAELIWEPLFDKYRRALHRSTEACDEFHYFSLLDIIGTLLNRKVTTPYGRLLFPNFYVVLVGESAISRKTTAQRFAVQLMEKIGEDVNILGSFSSAEGLLRTLGAYCPDEDDIKQSEITLANLEEFSTLLRKSRQEAISNLTPMLTEVYDLPSKLTLPRVKRPLRVDKPFLSILAGTTPEWMESSIRSEEIAGGFCNRFLYIAGTPKAAIPSPESPNVLILSEVEQEIKAVIEFWDSKENAVLKLTESAKVVWDSFYSTWRRKKETDIYTQILIERIPEYIRKMALVSAATKMAEEIDTDSLQVALAAGEYAEISLRKVFSTIAIGGPIEKCEKRILMMLEDKNPSKKRELQMGCGPYGSADMFRRALSALAFAQRVKEETDEGGQIWVKKFT